MKHIIVLYDGMADQPNEALGGKTPMQLAHKPLFDAMGRDAEVGMVQTVAKGLRPGSDVANLSVLGYDPKECYTGRSPLEAVSIGVPMGEEDLTLRCNLVSLSGEADFAAKTMLDYSGGDISTPEAAQLIAAVQADLGGGAFTYYAGVAYRHCLLWRGAKEKLRRLAPLTPPHDITDKPIAGHLPQTPESLVLLQMMEQSAAVLKAHPVNLARCAAGKLPANAIWLWGEGSRPALPLFAERFGCRGSIISAVDLLKGIGILAGMRTPEVEGATAYIDTNYEGKARCAVEELQSGADFVYLHIEATDECGHRGEAENKVRAIELIDERVLPILLEYLDGQEDYALMILPDHPTPLALKTHTGDAVPYMLFRKSMAGSGRGVPSVTEESAAATGRFIAHGPDLIKRFMAI
ncbi:MAG: cofactor-independent phosphoglycerate mutase [Oscillospiraceae bacterium]|jgi:2,3-bisphosphoglycerate-independent phosphoglycerate mutase|nr:cofactor-independent phosphoglycerate mutase [Oscillospiraceae bacterium]